MKNAIKKDIDQYLYDWEDAEVICNNLAGKYLSGKRGMIKSIASTELGYLAEVEIRIHGETSTFYLDTNKFFLEYPENYPVLPITVENPTKRGGGKHMGIGKWPRAFKWLFYLAILFLVWHIVLHIDSIAMWFVHLPIFHR